MPVRLFQFNAAAQNLFYMLGKVPPYLFSKMFKPQLAVSFVRKAVVDWAHFALRTLRIHLVVKNEPLLAQVDWTRPVVVVANHNSYADIPVLLAAANRPLGFLAKHTLGFIPILAYWMRKIGCVFFNRKKHGGGQKMIAAVKEAASANGGAVHIVVFPEGTRSKDGQIGSFKSGAFRMAKETQGTILPIYLTNTVNSFGARKATDELVDVGAQILEPIDVEALGRLLEREVDVKADLMLPLEAKFRHLS
jgi:1-acyl-sn-glycerol-3-phosphate acyltransferase